MSAPPRVHSAFVRPVCRPGHLPNGLIQEVHRRFLIRQEARIEYRGALVPAIRSDDGEAAGQCRHITHRNTADGQWDIAIETPAALHQEPAVPTHRQCDCKADGVRLAIMARARLDDAVDAAVSG
jgi:hypothetical protein